MTKPTANVLISACLGLAATAAHADFDAAANFSATSNPNGAWSYGWTQTLGSTFIYDAIHAHDNASGIDSWNGSVASPLGNFPGVIHNGTNQTSSFSTVIYSPGQLGLHPGPNGEYSVVRFTVQSDGQYFLSSGFSGLDFVGPTTTDVHVLINFSSIFNGVVSGFGSGPSFSSVLNLKGGDKLDFAVGFGSNATYFYDSTGLAAHINAVPEPTTQATICVGIALLLGYAQRRKQSTSQISNALDGEA